MAKQIYYLQSCDAWKSNDSMKLLFIGTSQQKLKMKIAKEIEEGNMEYDDNSLSSKQQVKRFKEDWNKETRDIIDSRLTYGYFDYTYDNEEM